MRVLLQITLCCLLAGGAMAQRRGMGGSGGGFHGGGMAGGFHGSIGGFGHGTFVGGFHGGFSGFHGGFINRGFGFGGFYGGYYPSYGLYSPWWGYDYSYPYYDYGYGYGYGYSYPVYQSSPNVTVVYPAAQPAPTTVYVERANPTMRSYDQYGQEIMPSAGGSQSSGSPIYLIAFKDGVIRAAASYSVEGNTLRYVTLQREERQAPLDTVDRNLSLQLNRERRVSFQLPE